MSNIEWDYDITDAELEEVCVAAEENDIIQTTKRPLKEESPSSIPAKTPRIDKFDEDYFEGDEFYDENDIDECTVNHFYKKHLWRTEKKFTSEYEPKMCSSLHQLHEELYATRTSINNMWNHCPVDEFEAEWHNADMNYLFNSLPIEMEHFSAIEYEQKYMHLVTMWWNRLTDELLPNEITRFFVNKK